MNDILIKGGLVYDGAGGPGRQLDVTIDGTKISGLHKDLQGKAGITIDAKGTIVCPGFIDMHTHSDLNLLGLPLAESKIRQGVTTELVGNCGSSAAPLLGATRAEAKKEGEKHFIDVNWTSIDEYLLKLADIKTSVNVATLVGAGAVRACVLGDASGRPTDNQMAEMKKLVADAMIQGAYGLSTGLIYTPDMFFSTDEIVKLAAVASSMGGFYSSHIRGEARGLLNSVEEAIKIGREAMIRVEISHLKAAGKNNWGLVRKALAIIESARMTGLDIGFDVYPYTASQTALESILSPWMREGGKQATLARLKDPAQRDKQVTEFENPDTPFENTVAEDGWENIVVLNLRAPSRKNLEGRSIADIARSLDKDPAEVAFDLLIEEDLEPSALFHEMCEDDVRAVIRHPSSCIASDGESEAPYGPTGSSPTHPRSYGAFPRTIRKYVLDEKVLTMEGAIRKMTSAPAVRIGLPNRGMLAKGMAADVVVFDPATIGDVATFDNPHRYANGIKHVIVNGSITIHDGRHTRERAGLVLRHKPSIS